MWHERALFALEDDGVRLHALQVMPYPFLDVHTIAAFLLAEHHTLYHRAVVIICRHLYPAPQHHERLILCRMPMDGHLRPRLHCIEHTMALVLQRLVEVIVHPQPLRRLRLGRYPIQQFYVNDLHANPQLLFPFLIDLSVSSGLSV